MLAIFTVRKVSKQGILVQCVKQLSIKEATEVFVYRSEQGVDGGGDYNRVESEITQSLHHRIMSSGTIVNNCENGDCFQQQSSRRQQEKRKRSRGSTSLGNGDGNSSIVVNNNPPRSHGASDVHLPPTRRGQGNGSSSRRSLRSSRTDERSGSSSDEDPDIEPGSNDEDDLTPAERNIPGTQLLKNLGKHPSVYARAGLNPLTKGLSFRGAWKKAVTLYRVANNQYKQLFIDAGFGDFLEIVPVDLPQGYLIALMERWFAETNTLHLPCCEIGPTPLDWTMITGVRFGGELIKLNSKYETEKVRRLLGVRGISGSRIRLSAIKPRKELVEAVPPSDEAKERIFRRLFLYVIGSCFFGNNQSVIHSGLVQFLEDIHTVRTYNWGQITYAAFLTGMRRKVTRKIGSFTAFWQFLPFWAFEYLNICRPEHAEADDFPRATRWKFPRNLGTLDNSELTASRCQLDYVDDKSKVTWQPYLASKKYNSAAISETIELANSRVRFIGFDTWEYYLGERCQRQLGLPCLVPSDPPEMMHGTLINNCDVDTSTVSSAQYLVSAERLDYASWFTDNSIGKIVDVTRLIGGTDIGRKVIGHWMEKYRPGMIHVPQSETEEIEQGLNTADAERAKLQEELARVRRGSDA
ncbi:protein MAINTENANCE OF MERISTEMS-like [Apium graveolens]|uniref:protein MAINTENANCE OF MERISTEMS-like n=1 Tax=Apium graveolens TaxID=4045 RepID=UPI003D7A968B